MDHGSWLKAHDSCLKARGSWLMAKKNLALGSPGLGPNAKFFSATSHSLEPGALRHEP